MCGRFQISWPFRDLVALYGLARAIIDEDILPRLNIGPTYVVPVFTEGRVGQQMRWGYPASWLAGQGKDPWSRVLINAKAEDAHKKRTWAKSLRERRCLVPASGFYEWARKGRSRYPLLFERSDDAPMAFAGIWGDFDKDGERVQRFSVLTTGPGPELGRFHDRGPVIVDPADWDRWLDPGLDSEGVAGFLAPARPGLLRFRPVGTGVNNIKTSQPDLTPDWSLDDLAQGA